MTALVAWTLAGVLAVGVACFVLLAFAPEIEDAVKRLLRGRQ